MLLRGDMTKTAEKWPIIGWWWHHLRRLGYSYRQKKIINRRQSKKPPSLRLSVLKSRISILLVELVKTLCLFYFRSVKFHCVKGTYVINSLLTLVKIVLASQHKRQPNKSLSRFVDNWKHRLGPKRAKRAKRNHRKDRNKRNERNERNGWNKTTAMTETTETRKNK